MELSIDVELFHFDEIHDFAHGKPKIGRLPVS